MSISTRRANLEPSLAAACVVAALTFAATYGICTSYKNRVEASHVRSEMMYAASVSDRKLISAQMRLERERPAALAYVARVAKASSGPQAMALFLQDVQAAAQACGVDLGGVERVTRVAPKTVASASPEYLGSDAVTVKARGTFVNLLRFEQVFTQRNSLVGIEGIDFTATSPATVRTSVVSAQITATVYHLSTWPDQEKK